MKLFWYRKKKYLLGTLFGITFIVTLIYNIPSWALSNLIQNYSNGRLKLYDTHGTFWKGSGLLVANGQKLQSSSPLLLINWTIVLGTSKFIDIKFNVGNKLVADIYFNKTGVSLDKLNLSLSITQVEQLFDVVKAMSISGNLNMSADHLQIGKKMAGTVKINLDNISSGISRVNPLGSYAIQIATDTGGVEVSSNSGSILMLDGSGSINGLTLSARVKPENKEDMLQFITLMGIPKPDGSYQFKIF